LSPQVTFSEVQIAFIWDWGIGWRVDPTGFNGTGLIAAHAALIVSQKVAVRGYAGVKRGCGKRLIIKQ
jgi:hypothetical protein